MERKRHKKSLLAVNVGLAANAVLAVVKTFIGIVGNSPALLADGINSTSDVAYGVVVSVFMRLSGKPADEEHPYGHYQLESIAAVVVGAFVMTTGVSIFWSAINSVYELYRGTSDFGGASSLALLVAVGTIVVKIGLTWWTKNVAQETSNSAVLALALDHRNDIFAASAATVGIFLGIRGYVWVDPLAGALVSLIIFHTGLEIIRDAAADLMNTLPGKVMQEQIEGLLVPVNGVLQVEEVHANKFGPYSVVNITIGVDPLISVAQGDKIATEVENTLMQEMEFIRKVYVHCHPVKTE